MGVNQAVSNVRNRMEKRYQRRWRLRSQQITANWSRMKRNVSPSRITEDIEIDAEFPPYLEKGLGLILCQY